MIQLHQDYLFFETSSGETIPCSAELVAIELVGGNETSLDPELVRQAALAVLHYFRNDLGRTCVSIADFSLALERVLMAFGLKVSSGESAKAVEADVCDLRQIAVESGEGYELAFFPKVRQRLRSRMEGSPELLRFRGLRGCVKQILRAKRWSHRCQVLSDQIVEYLRECLSNDGASSRCGLVVR